MKISFSEINKISSKELRVLCKEIAILLESGTDIIRLLDLAKEKKKKNTHKSIMAVSKQIQKGMTLTRSFKSTDYFPSFFIHMLNAGEISGKLDSVMELLSKYYDKEYKLKSKILTIMIYPIVLLILSVFSILFILLFIIPNFQIVFISNGINPPFISRLMIELSIFLKENLFTINLVFILSSICLVYLFLYSSSFKKAKDKIKIKAPIIKSLNKVIITTRFSRALFMMLNSGIHVVEALIISSNVVDNIYFQKYISDVSISIRNGKNIGNSIENIDFFPDLFVSMIKAGEVSGKLDESLESASNFYENELNTKIEQLLKLIEPLVIVILGVIIGSSIIAMVTPMFEIISSV